MIDTHCHLDFKHFKKDRQEVIERSFKNGIEKIINIGCNLKRSRSSAELAQKHDKIWAAVGIHPHDIEELLVKKKSKYLIKKKTIEELKKLAQSKKVVAIGEIGLDHYFPAKRGKKVLRAKRAGPYFPQEGALRLPPLWGEEKQEMTDEQKKQVLKEMQVKGFKAQIELAQELGLPVILHIREAHQKAIKILNSINGVVHCFSGSWQDAQKYLKLGLHISFTGLITFTEKYNEVVEKVPLEKILLETDCPFLTPEPYRGERCQPWMVKFVAQKIARLKDIKIDKIVEQTTENAETLFGI